MEDEITTVFHDRVIIINLWKQNIHSGLTRDHLCYLWRPVGTADWLVWGQWNDKWLVMLKPMCLPFSPEPQKQSEWLTTVTTAVREEADWPPDPGWMTGKMTSNKRSDSTLPYNMFLLSLVAGWGWRSGGPSDPNINNHNPFIMLLHNTHPFLQTIQSLYLAKRPDQRQAI